MTRKRILSLLLTLVMVLSMLPGGTVAVAADGTEGTAIEQQDPASETTLPEDTDGAEKSEEHMEATETPTPTETPVVPATPTNIPTESTTDTEQSGDPMETVFTVTFEVNGGSEVEPQEVKDGETTEEPEEPTKEGFTFGGWFEDGTYTVAFDFATPITGDVKIYAKWTDIEADQPAFSDTKTVNGVAVTVSAPEGVFPKESSLSVDSVPVFEQSMVDEAVENERDANANVAVSYTFDIKVLDAEGNEVQPADAQSVKVSFALAEAKDDNLEAQVYHISDDGTAEALDTSINGDAVEAVTDGFSFYTVEFTYGTMTYVLPGGSEVKLSDVLSYVGLSGEVTSASGSNDELFSVTKESGDWMILSHQPFDTEETLSVTINGIIYEIIVTDTNVSGTIYASNLADNDNLVLTGDTKLVMDVPRKLTSISGDYELNIEGNNALDVVNPNGDTINVKSLRSSVFLRLISGKDGINCKKTISLTKGVFISAEGYGIYSEENISITGAAPVSIYSKESAIRTNGALSVNMPDNSMTVETSGNDAWGIVAQNELDILAEKISVTSVSRAVVSSRNTVRLSGDVTVNSSKNGAITAFYGGVYLWGSISIKSGGGKGLENAAIFGSHVSIRDCSNLEVEATGDDNSGIIGLQSVNLSIHTNGVFISAEGYGIYSEENISITGAAPVSIYSKESAIRTKNGALSVNMPDNSMTVKTSGNDAWGIVAQNELDILAEKISVTSVSRAVVSSRNTVRLSGDVTVNSSKNGAILAYYGGVYLEGNISIKSGGGDGLENAAIYGSRVGITNCSNLEVEATGDDNGGIIGLQSVNLYINGTAKITSDGDGIKTHAEHGASSIILKGNIEVTSLYGDAIIGVYEPEVSYKIFCTILIRDGSNITANGSGYGLFAREVKMEGGVLYASSSSRSAIFTYGDLVLHGVVTAKSDSDTFSAIQCHDAVIDCSKLEAKTTGKGKGIYSYKASLKGDITVISDKGTAIHATSIEVLTDSSITARGAEYGLLADDYITISDTVSARGYKSAIQSLSKAIEIKYPLHIVKPSGGKLSDDKRTVINENASDGIAVYVVIDKKCFTLQPQDVNMQAGEQHTVTWETNFIPVKLERLTGQFLESVDKTFENPETTSESFDASGIYAYRAWYGQGENEYIDSRLFVVNVHKTITFNSNGGEGYMSPVTTPKTSFILPPCSFTPPSGMRFLKWDKGAPGNSITINGDTEIKAVWVDDISQIVYDPGEGTGTQVSVNVNNGSQYMVGTVFTEFTAPGGKEFSHYQINGDPNNTCLPGDRITINKGTTLTAIWSTPSSVALYVVKYLKNGGEGEEKTYNITFDGHKMTLSENWFTPPENHVFKCWNVNGADKDPYDRIAVDTDITIKAVWREVQDRTISFNMNGHGTAIAPKTVKEGKPLWHALPSPAPTEEGFIFEGWYWEAECVNKFNFNGDVPATDVTVYAKWSEQIKKINIAGLKEPVGGQTAVSRIDLTTPDDAPFVITNLKWLDEDRDPIAQPFQFAAGQKYSAVIEIAPKDGYAFKDPGMYFGGFFDEVTLNGGTDLIMQYNTSGNYRTFVQTVEMTAAAVTTYSVTFDANNGGGTMTPNPVTVNAGEQLTLPECGFTPPSADKMFDKWDAGYPGYKVDITSDCVIQAIWKDRTADPITYSVTVNTGANGTANASATSATQGRTITVTANPDDGYELDKITWTPDGGTATDITSTKSFEMPEAKVTVNVSFKASSVTPPGPATVTGISLVTPGKTAYTVGETLDVSGMEIKVDYSDGTSATIPVAAAMVSGFDSSAPATSQTLTITYEGKTTTYDVSISAAAPVTYDITVNAGAGGTANASASKATAGTKITVTANPNGGYEIDKITLTPEGGSETDITSSKSFTMPEAKVTVNVSFKASSVTPPGPTTYTVTFKDGDSVLSTVTVNSGEKVAKPADPTKTDHTFNGWYADATFTAAFDFDQKITANATVYAKFTKNSVTPPGTITYTVTGGANNTWTKGSSATVTITVKRSEADDTCFSHFTGVEIDGVALAVGDYEAVSGSTVVTLKAAALQKLSVGSHTVTVKFDDGQASTGLTVKAASGSTDKPTSPKTGDDSNLRLWVLLMLLSILGFITTVAIDRKKRQHSR